MSRASLESIAGGTIDIGGRPLVYSLRRSRRRTLEIAVNRAGSLEIRAPAEASVERIEQRIRARSAWIAKQLASFDTASGVTAPRLYVSGETHRYLGRQLRLRVEPGRPAHVRVASGRLFVTVANPTDSESVRAAIERWLRARARAVFTERLNELLTRPALHGFEPSGLVVRRMETRWGSCTASGRIVLNLELVRLPSHLIELVIVHELCHLKSARHDRHFERIMSRVLPNWRDLSMRLAQQTGALAR